MSIRTRTREKQLGFAELMTEADKLIVFRSAVEGECHQLDGHPELKLIVMRVMQLVIEKQVAMQALAFKSRKLRRKAGERVH